MSKAIILTSIEINHSATITVDFALALAEGDIVAPVTSVRRSISMQQLVPEQLDQLDAIFAEAGYPAMRPADRVLIREARQAAEDWFGS